MKAADDNHFMVNISSVTNLLPQDFNCELAIIAEDNGKKYILKSASKNLCLELIILPCLRIINVLLKTWKMENIEFMLLLNLRMIPIGKCSALLMVGKQLYLDKG